MVVVTIKESNLSRARRVLAGVASGAARLELRVDDLAAEDWPSLLREASGPVIVTCRSVAQGGSFSGTEAERVAILERALQAGADLIDVEVGSAAVSLLKRFPARRFLFSVHDFEAGLGRVEHHMEQLLETPRPAVLKLAFTPARLAETLVARRLLERVRREKRRMALVTMGEAGQPGRILAPSWGSVWTYAVPDGSPPVAPGQLSLGEMRDLYDVHGIRPATVITGIVGWPVAASLSPWMHNRATRQVGLDARYLPFPAPDVGDLLTHAADWGLTGVSVTHPHKAAVLDWLDERSPAVEACQAANTLLFRQGRLRGENTDAAAAIGAMEEALPAGLTLAGLRVGIIGAGGGARAVAWASLRAGAHVTLYTRHRGRGAAAAKVLKVDHLDLSALDPASADVVVNATPVGSGPELEGLPVAAEKLGGRLLFDMVSNPKETRLMAAARQRGLAVQGGLAMLVRQGEVQFRLWHGMNPPSGLFLAAALEGLGRAPAAEGSQARH